MNRVKPWLRLPRFWLSIAIVGVWALVVGLMALMSFSKVPQQPLAFDHSAHIDNNIPCLFCHSGANRGPSATLPTLAKCQGCHEQIQPDTEALVMLAEHIQNQEIIPWTPVAILPDFVYFSHQPHLAAAVNCEDCHGDVGQMKVAKPVDFEMGWCLTCHRDQDAAQIAKLEDCATCHK